MTRNLHKIVMSRQKDALTETLRLRLITVLLALRSHASAHAAKVAELVDALA